MSGLQLILHYADLLSGLSDAQVRSLCTRILCGHGGVGLATNNIICSNLQMKVQNKISQITKQLLSGVCVCGNCQPMGTLTEDVCCRKTSCVTRYEEFYLLCVNYLVLTVAILGRVDVRADPIDYSPLSYRICHICNTLQIPKYLKIGNFVKFLSVKISKLCI